MLQHAKLGKLREQLQQASENAPYVSKSELLQMIQDRYMSEALHSNLGADAVEHTVAF